MVSGARRDLFRATDQKSIPSDIGVSLETIPMNVADGAIENTCGREIKRSVCHGDFAR